MEKKTVFTGWNYVIEETDGIPMLKEHEKGRYGTVYEIEKEGSGNIERAALKIIDIPNETDMSVYTHGASSQDQISQILEDERQRAEETIKLQRRVQNNPHIVRIEDYLMQEKGNNLGWELFLRMNLLDLTNIGECGAFSQEDVRLLGIDICDALEECHSQGLLHRNIKPGNIYRDESGRYELDGFGIPELINPSVYISAQLTEPYAAPEVVRFEEQGANTDVYSLGLVMYELLNHGRRPFEPTDKKYISQNARSKAYVRRFQGDQIEPIKGVSDVFNAIILKACAYDPNDRFASAAEMRKQLEGLKLSKGLGLSKEAIEEEIRTQRRAQLEARKEFRTQITRQRLIQEVERRLEKRQKQDDFRPQTESAVSTEKEVEKIEEAIANLKEKTDILRETNGEEKETKNSSEQKGEGDTAHEFTQADISKMAEARARFLAEFGIDPISGKPLEKIELEKVESVPKTVEDLLDELAEEKREGDVKIYHKEPSKGVKEVSTVTEKLQFIQSKLDMLKRKDTEIYVPRHKPVIIKETEDDE